MQTYTIIIEWKHKPKETITGQAHELPSRKALRADRRCVTYQFFPNQ